MAPKFPTPRADELVAALRTRLPEKTFRHCCGVAATMLDVTEQADITAAQAVTAGLLHDYCKAMKSDELLLAVEKYALEVPAEWIEVPSLLHGPVAAEAVRRDLNVSDPDVLDAIFWHTTGRPEWCRVGLALYFADFSESNRLRPEAEEARAVFTQKGFEAAVRFVADTKLRFVESRFKLDAATAAFGKWIREGWHP